MFFSIFRFFSVLLVLLVSLVTSATASTYVPVEDDLVYTILTRLETEGVIQSGLLDTKPISRKEAFRLLHEAETNSATRSNFIRSLVSSLKDRLGPEIKGTEVKAVDTVYADYIYTNSDDHAINYKGALENEQALNHNNNGDLYKRGSNERIGFTSRLEDWGPLSLSLNPEFRYPAVTYIGYPDSEYSKNEFVLKKVYAVLDLGWDIVVGKDSQWWGPGYNSAIILSNNAEPFTMVKLTNPEPVRLPWILDSLGPLRFTFFATRLDKERPVSEPYLYGMRFDFKPSQYVEIGLEKTALLGGSGQPDDAKTWFDSLTFQTHAHEGPDGTSFNIDDQRAGLNLKITIPWQLQPMQIYVEADGEDVSSRLPIPQDWAFVGGLYLPRIAGAERLDLRIEYAITRGKKSDPYVWYSNSTFSSYTYKGNVIGNYIGTDAENLFAQISYLIPESNGKFFISFDREKHNLYVEGEHETIYDVSFGLIKSLTGHIDIATKLSRGVVSNINNSDQPSMDITELSGQIGYRF